MNDKELNHFLINCEAVAMITIRNTFMKNESMLRENKTLKSIILLDDEAPEHTLLPNCSTNHRRQRFCPSSERKIWR